MMKIGIPAEDVFVSALVSPYTDVRDAARRVLRSLEWQPENNMHRVFWLIAQAKWQEVADLLVKIGKPSVERLIPLLQEEHSPVRLATVQALGKIGDKQAIELLITSLREDNPDVRLATVQVLGEIGNKQAVELLITSLQDDNSNVRLAAVQTLGKIGDKQAADPLSVLLKSNKEQTQEAVAIALGQMCDVRGVKPLISIIQKKKRSSYAKKALEDILDKTVQEVKEEDLRQLVALSDEFGSFIKESIKIESPCGMSYTRDITESVKVEDYSRLRQLARQELIRRGLAA